MAAPRRIINTNEVVFAVSSITSCIVFSLLKSRFPLHTRDMTTKPDPKRPKNIPILSSNELINFIFISY